MVEHIAKFQIIQIGRERFEGADVAEREHEIFEGWGEGGKGLVIEGDEVHVGDVRREGEDRGHDASTDDDLWRLEDFQFQDGISG